MIKRIAIFRNCTCTRIFLASINILFILIGIVIISLGVILLKSNILANLTKSDTINKTFGLPIFIYFGIGLGAIVLIIGIIGIWFIFQIFIFSIIIFFFFYFWKCLFINIYNYIGLISCARDGLRPLKIVYLILVAIIFLLHLIIYIMFTTTTCSIQNKLKSAMISTVDKLNSNATSSASKAVYCETFRSFSILYKCCGANGPYDFNSADLVDNCCDRQEIYRDGCTSKVIGKLRKNAKSYIVIPNGLIVCVELILAFLALLNSRKLRNRKCYGLSETNVPPKASNLSTNKSRPSPKSPEVSNPSARAK